MLKGIGRNDADQAGWPVSAKPTTSLLSYDGDGNMVKVAEANTKVYLYQGVDILYYKNTNTGTSYDELYGDGMHIAERSGGSSSYYHTDALGSIRLIMAGGVTSFKSDYKPYGNPYQKTGTITFGYTGKLYDGTIGGLYYYNARFYDPDFGRFISEDAKSGNEIDPMTLNRYIYSRDNPEKFIDLDGHDFGIFSSLATDLVSGVSSVGSAVENAWESLPPTDQAVIATAAIDAGAVVGSIACAGTCASILVSAAVSATVYTAAGIATGNQVTAAGAIGAAVAGGATFGLGSVFSGALAGAGGFLGSAAVSGIASVAGTFAGYGATGLLGGTVSTSPNQLELNFAIGVLTPDNLGDEVMRDVGLSGAGRPATQASTLLDAIANPFDHPRAAFQVYSGVVNWGGHVAGDLAQELGSYGYF